MKAQVFENGKFREERVVLITGAYGFIGSNLVNYWVQSNHNDKLVLLDGMTYAARPEHTKNYLAKLSKSVPIDVCEEIVNIQDQVAVARVMQKHRPDLVLHLAAESHVCRSISGPADFMKTNVMGTFNLIEEFYQLHKGDKTKRFVHISTDEVFGELHEGAARFNEHTQIQPRSPYAASKASSDHIVQCYHHTYGVPTIITNCSNNYGPNQHDEKLVPATIKRILLDQPIKVHGDGRNIRDWLFVMDHIRAIELLAEKGMPGLRYCIGGDNELRNIEMVKLLHAMTCSIAGIKREFKVEYTQERPTDDKRYAISAERLKNLGWMPRPEYFSDKMADTIKWYLAEWGRDMTVGSAKDFDAGVFNV